MTCACLGSLTAAPGRFVIHTPQECVSTPEGRPGDAVHIASGRCPRCQAVRQKAWELCRGCSHAEAR